MALLAGAAALAVVAAFDEVKMLCLVNRERTRRGLPCLGLSSRLNYAARKHSEEQADRNHMSHSGYGGSDPSRRISDAGFDWLEAGENIAYGYSDEKECMDHWMQSPGHKENILSSKYTHFGAGIGYSSSGQPYYTQDFAGDGHRHDFPECPHHGDYGSSSYDDDSYGRHSSRHRDDDGYDSYGRHSSRHRDDDGYDSYGRRSSHNDDYSRRSSYNDDYSRRSSYNDDYSRRSSYNDDYDSRYDSHYADNYDSYYGSGSSDNYDSYYGSGSSDNYDSYYGSDNYDDEGDDWYYDDEEYDG
jgi:hypothetical protein